jgi:hypothetical protein
MLQQALLSLLEQAWRVERATALAQYLARS